LFELKSKYGVEKEHGVGVLRNKIVVYN